jgi:hypothetical protein
VRRGKMVKRKLAGLAAIGMLGVGLTVGGATYALFTESVTNAGNSLTVGELKLSQNRDQGDTIPGPMFYSASSDPSGSFPYDTNKNAPYQPPGGEALGGWAPGDTVTRAMNIKNEGTLDAKITRLKASVNPVGVTTGTAYQEFISKMNIKVMYPAQDRILYDGPLSGLLNGWVDISIPLVSRAKGGDLNITFKASLDKTASNDIEDQSFVFDFSFYAEQLRNNP